MASVSALEMYRLALSSLTAKKNKQTTHRKTKVRKKTRSSKTRTKAWQSPPMQSGPRIRPCGDKQGVRRPQVITGRAHKSALIRTDEPKPANRAPQLWDKASQGHSLLSATLSINSDTRNCTTFTALMATRESESEGKKPGKNPCLRSINTKPCTKSRQNAFVHLFSHLRSYELPFPSVQELPKAGMTAFTKKHRYLVRVALNFFTLFVTSQGAFIFPHFSFFIVVYVHVWFPSFGASQELRILIDLCTSSTSRASFDLFIFQHSWPL
jgi:hypothetical protein